MKIALIGSAPSSVRLGPYGDPSWKIWGCSPGVYPVVPRSDAWFELHRWEPPVIGKPDQQKPWFSPEYCMWMAKQSCVWMAEAVPEIPNSKRLPAEDLVGKYGAYFFTSSLAWMFAMAIEEILKDRETFPRHDPDAKDCIGLWGVDMAATEEYGYQRAGCQFFAQIAAQLNINIVVPPESDLLMPAPLYGIVESDPMHIKLMARKAELTNRLNNVTAGLENARNEMHFLQGALDDLNYNLNTWVQLDDQLPGVKLAEIFAPTPVDQPNISNVKELRPGQIEYVDELPLPRKHIE